MWIIIIMSFLSALINWSGNAIPIALKEGQQIDRLINTPYINAILHLSRPIQVPWQPDIVIFLRKY